MAQRGQTGVQKQTQVRRNNSQPAYDETFAFSVPSDVTELRSTNISIQVMSKEMLRSDTVIGEVTIQDSSFISEDKPTFWSNLLNAPCSTISKWSELSVPEKL